MTYTDNLGQTGTADFTVVIMTSDDLPYTGTETNALTALACALLTAGALLRRRWRHRRRSGLHAN